MTSTSNLWDSRKLRLKLWPSGKRINNAATPAIYTCNVYIDASQSACMRVVVWVCVYASFVCYVLMYVRSCACMYGWMEVWMYVYIDTKTYLWTFSCAYICVRIYIYTYVWMCSCIYVMYVYAYVFICIYTHTHSHINTKTCIYI